MKKTVECYRCHNQINADYKHIKSKLVCPHCKAEMTYDGNSLRKLKLMRYSFVLLVFALLLIGFFRIERANDYNFIFIAILIALGISFFADKICLWLSFVLLNGKYVPITKEDRRLKRDQNIKARRK